MRIASMLSSATEIVYALGLQDHLVGISHECDYPAQALRLPRLSRSRFDPAGLTSGEIDAEVRRCMLEYGSVYEVDVDALRQVRPDVILTQAVCEVCAVPTGSVDAAVAALPWQPAVVSLDAHTLDGILHTMRQVADAAGQSARGEEGVARLRGRVDRVGQAVAGRPRPRVLTLEWLDPPFAPGHWVPEMVTLAGGDNLVGDAGSHSREIPWSRAEGLDPDRLLLVPCGYAMDRARQDADEHRAHLRRLAPSAIDGGRAAVGDSAYFSRSGPRVVDGIEALATWLHPDAGLTMPGERILERWR
ncbi:cobalamin-binding protein [Longimicrobium sp.]|uniref:cobalamin-binding protein n=1 Tax=Longimicrobium sp. TaxID=2029185 RepID=UPI002E32B2DB|nr:cobalamin-binding protein [Longimicrobium sp.]HEX6042623.1 cobalamin-binding protein [Longimicrobium sp.]